MKTILVPLDFSSVSQSVAEAAAELAHALNGSVVLLHVMWAPPSLLDAPGEPERIREFAADLEVMCTDRMREFLPVFQEKGIAVRVVCATGRPAAVIAEQAAKLAADYIVIGSHGHTAFHDLLLGGIASGVVKRAACPVVLVPSQRSEQRARRNGPATEVPALGL